MTELVYIGGYGRSGSTLLETLLTARPDVLACGEIAACLHVEVRRPCTCGKTCSDCELWGAFYKDRGKLRRWTHESLVLDLLEKASGRYCFLVDSSKTAWGSFFAPFKLWRNLGDGVHLIHVVRDPRGVSWSTLGELWKRRLGQSNPLFHYPKKMLRILWTTMGWWVANASCEIFAWRFPKQALRVRYEDLVDSPKEVLDGIFAWLAPNQSVPLADINAGDNRHQLHGNEGRRRISSLDDVHADIRWRNEMSAGQRRIASALTWPLRLRYGY